MIAVYKRVSTDKQDLAMQNHAVSEWMTKRGMSGAVEYADSGISGKTMKRPGIQALIADVEAGKITTVVVYRLDRISRDAISAMRLLLDWMQAGVEFFAVDQPILSLGKDNVMRLTITSLMAELAQIERETICSRVKAGLAAAKARGVKLGAVSKLTQAQRDKVTAGILVGRTYRDVARELGVSPSTVHRVAKYRD